jgi:hypothetical protein
MTNPTIPTTDYNAAYFEIINRIDAIEKRLPVKRERTRSQPTVSFNAPVALYNRLQEEASRLAITRSELLRMIVRNYLDTKDKPRGFAVQTIDDNDLIDL